MAAKTERGAPADLEIGPGQIPPEEPATAQPPALATERHILVLVAAELTAAGVAGESSLVQLLYLVVTSRLLRRPCSVVVKGPSAAGKSYVVEQVLGLFPAGAYYALSAMSERALVYDREPLEHRMLVLYEAVGIRGDTASYLMRSLLSEGRINYVTVVRTKKGLEHLRITRDGPTGLITTTTSVSLHPENETRLLSVTVTDTPEQTRAVMIAQATRGRSDRNHAPWHELQDWLAGSVCDVVVPYAETLAGAIPPVSARLRRDFPTLITLIEAHALLHQVNRQRDHDGAVVANYDDYATVRMLVADVLADAVERSVSPTVRETVAAVAELTRGDLLGDGVPVVRVAAILGIDKSSASRRVRVAIARGYIRNLEERRGRSAQLTLGEPVPDDVALLPTTAELERLHGCAADDPDDLPLELEYPSSALETDIDDASGPLEPAPSSRRSP